LARVELLGHRRAAQREVGETQEIGLERKREERSDNRVNLKRHRERLKVELERHG
jgi:hypothetical protein